MSLTSRTDKWASKLIIILQLATWNAVGIVLLHKGVGTLRRKLEENYHVTETNRSIDLDIESAIMKRVESGYNFAVISNQRQMIDKNEKMIIRLNPASSFGNGRNRSELNVIGNAFENVSEEQLSTSFLSDPFVIPTTDRETPSSRIKNYLTEINSRIDYPESKTSNQISRIVRNREHIFRNRISKNVQIKEDVMYPESVSEPVSKKEVNHDAKGEDLDFVETTSRPTAHGTTSSIREKTDEQVTNTLWRNKSRMRYSRISDSGAAAAIAMVTIGIIMLLVGPIVIILRILDERRQARKLIALSTIMREDLPPTYEQAVFMTEAPRYSTLALNDGRSSSSSPSPPPSPSFAFSNPVIKPHSM